MYPAELADEDKQLLQERRRLELADELSVDLGAIAVAAITGMSNAEHKVSTDESQMETLKITSATAKQIEALGYASLHTLITLDRTPLDEKTALGRRDEYALAA